MKYPRHGHRIGRTNTPTYTSWEAMKRRCAKGGIYWEKGIMVCSRWLLFDNFLEDMGARPEGMTIDRIDSNGDYEPNNCRWATAIEQARNRCDRVYIEFQGRKMLLVDWATETGIAFSCLYKRIYNLNWPIEKAIGTPSRGRQKNAVR